MIAPIDLSLRWQVVEGDCLAVMPTLPAESVDAVVTDPPYGLGFMGKKWDEPGAMVERRAAKENAWDHVGGNHNPTCSADSVRTKRSEGAKFQKAMEAWAVEALRVAKPCAHLLAFGGTRTFHRLTCAIEYAGWEIRDCLSWLYGSGFPKSHNGSWGGTALKPAWEPIVMARKPLIGTVAANHAAHGTGALNIDGCRIDASKRPKRVCHGEDRPTGIYGGGAAGSHSEGLTDEGRWPANVVLDEAAAAMLDAETGTLQSGEPCGVKAGGAGNAFGTFAGGIPVTGYGDSGGASRFFYTAKASRSEREAGLREAGRQVLGDYQGTPEHPPKVGEQRVRNTHPTVKPVDLMRWLVRLVTPTGGLVLDPFAGSGTTGIAASEEGCRALLIERESAYVEIARARTKAAAAQAVLPLAGGA